MKRTFIIFFLVGLLFGLLNTGVALAEAGSLLEAIQPDILIDRNIDSNNVILEQGIPDISKPPLEVYVSPVGGAYNSAQLVELTASGPASIYYTLDGTTPTASSLQFIGLPISITDSTMLSCMAIDEAGNQSQVYVHEYIIDALAPMTTIAFSGSQDQNGWFTSDTTVTLDASDNASGIEITQYRLSGGDWITYTDPFVVGAENATAIDYCSLDKAGNQEQVNTRIVNERATVNKVIQPDAVAGKDTSIIGSHAYYDNQGAAQWLQVDSYLYRSLLQFDLSSIPRDAIVLNSQLGLYCYAKYNQGSQIGISAHRITRSWVEGTGVGSNVPDGATWALYDGRYAWQSYGGDIATTPEYTLTGIPVANSWYNWDITSLTQKWVNRTVANFGILLKGESNADRGDFYSSDYSGEPSKRPKLVVTYRIPDTTAPTAAISSPVEDERISGTYHIRVDAADDINLGKIEIYIDDNLTYTHLRPQETVWISTNLDYAWDTAATDFSGNRLYADGPHVIYALAYDTAGHIIQTASRTVAADNTSVKVTKVIQPDAVAGKDAYINGNNGINMLNSKNFGAWTICQIGQSDARYQDLNYPGRALLQFDLSTIPANAAIMGAQLQLSRDSGDIQSYEQPLDISAHQVTRAWVEGTKLGASPADGTTWNSYNGISSWSQPGGDFIAIPESIEQGNVKKYGWYTWDISRLAQGWLNSSISNYGVLLKGSVESGNPTAIYRSFYLSDSEGAGARPRVLVTFRIPDSIAPSIDISSPFEGQRIGGPNKIYLAASDSIELSKVEVYVDDKLIHTQMRPDVICWDNTSINYTWNTAEVDSSGNRIYTDGEHTIIVKAYDTTGNVGTLKRKVMVDNNSPITVVLQPDAASGKDTMITAWNTHAGCNFGAVGAITVGHWLNSSDGYTAVRSLLQFDLSSIPSNAAITSAQLKLHYAYGSNTMQVTDVSVHRLTRNWVEGSGFGFFDTIRNGATWTTYDGTNKWTNSGGDFDPAPEAIVRNISTIYGWYAWDITSLAQSWWNGNTPNYGVLLRSSIESWSYAVNRSFESSDSQDPSKRPQLVVTYTVPKGIVPPTTHIETLPNTPDGESGWYKTAPAITLSAENATIFYRWDEGTDVRYTEPIVAPEGVHTLSLHAVDAMNNTETVRTFTYKGACPWPS